MDFEDFAERLDVLLDEDIEKQSEELADNRASDLADYRLRTGKIRGLRRAKELVRDLVRNFLNEDDTDEPSSGGLG